MPKQLSSTQHMCLSALEDITLAPKLLLPQGGTFGFIHDILVTKEHYIILENPISMNFQKLLTKYVVAKACLAECLQYEGDRATKIHVIKRPGKKSSVLGEASITSDHACMPCFA